MENTFQTSFIPKKPITPTKKKSSKPRNLFLVIATILLILSVIAGGGLFLYKEKLSQDRRTKSNSLATIRNNFEEEAIKELRDYSNRMKTAKTILDNHIVLSPLFGLLSEITIPQVQYNSFKHSVSEKGYSVKLDGLALDYRSIALQADMFNDPRGKYFKSVLFSNLNKDLTGKVKFNLEFEVEPSLLSYNLNDSHGFSNPNEEEFINESDLFNQDTNDLLNNNNLHTDNDEDFQQEVNVDDLSEDHLDF